MVALPTSNQARIVTSLVRKVECGLRLTQCCGIRDQTNDCAGERTVKKRKNIATTS